MDDLPRMLPHLQITSPPETCPNSPRHAPNAPLPSTTTPRKRSAASPASPVPTSCDRFIPNRGAFDIAVSKFEIARRCDAENARHDYNASPAKEEYKRELASTLYHGQAASNRVLAFKSTHTSSPRSSAAPATPTESLRALYTLNKDSLNTPKRFLRRIPQMAERILDAPDLIDDYYLNLLDWNCDNILVIALGSAVYLWNNTDGQITKLMQEPPDSGFDVTSVSWAPGGKQLMVGTSRATVELWDTVALKRVRTLEGHSARVGALAWANAHHCTSGSRAGEMRHHDTRAPPHSVAAAKAHQQEVCGLKWSSTHGSGGSRLASGGNDNLLCIWDDRLTTAPQLQLARHTAAVKALAWAPWQRHLLASGGGTADRMIRFWNASTGQCLNAVDTHSQVCALQWSHHDKEIVSSHGFSHNQLILWRYPSMVKLAELSGHTSRVLHLAQSPDGVTVASAGADETLRFWKIFNGPGAKGRDETDLRNGITEARTIR